MREHWNKAPHYTAYVDFASHITPWASFTTPTSLTVLRSRLENALESLVLQGILLGNVSGSDILSTLNKRHAVHAALRRVIAQGGKEVRGKLPLSALWSRALVSFSQRAGDREIDTFVRSVAGGEIEDASYMRECAISYKLAKEIIGVHHEWRRDAIRDINETARFSRSLANSCTDWPCFLIELLSGAAETDHFQV